MDPADGGAEIGVGGSARGSQNSESRSAGGNGEDYIVASRIARLDERPVEIRIGRIGQVDGRGGDPGTTDLIACSARAGAVVTIGIDIDLIAGGARGQAGGNRV